MEIRLGASPDGLQCEAESLGWNFVSGLKQKRDVIITAYLGKSPRGYPGQVVGRERLEAITVV